MIDFWMEIALFIPASSIAPPSLSPRFDSPELLEKGMNNAILRAAFLYTKLPRKFFANGKKGIQGWYTVCGLGGGHLSIHSMRV